MAKGSAADQALGGVLQARLARGGAVKRVDFTASQLADPIAKGRLLASIQDARVVVSVGDEATSFAAGEIEETRVYFIAAVLPGAALKSPSISGTFSYGAQDLLDALPDSWVRKLGVLYTPGYEPLAAELSAAAAAKGASPRAARVASLKELPKAVEALAGSARAVLVMGDPLLVEGAGFEYLSEALLARDVALIATRPSEVLRGAVLCSIAAPEALAQAASEDVWRLAAGQAAQPRLALAPAGGAIVFHAALGRRFGLAPKAGWRPAR